MRNVVLIMTASIDGFVVAPTGHAGGLPEPEELERWKLDRIRRAGTHIMGRVTYLEIAVSRRRHAECPPAPTGAGTGRSPGSRRRRRPRTTSCPPSGCFRASASPSGRSDWGRLPDTRVIDPGTSDGDQALCLGL